MGVNKPIMSRKKNPQAWMSVVPSHHFLPRKTRLEIATEARPRCVREPHRGSSSNRISSWSELANLDVGGAVALRMTVDISDEETATLAIRILSRVIQNAIEDSSMNKDRIRAANLPEHLGRLITNTRWGRFHGQIRAHRGFSSRKISPSSRLQLSQ